jgi:predicted ABC-type exoprotein transport system permease subunit
MTQQEKQEVYPVRTMHEFLYQVEHEINRFKRGAVISLLISIFMLALIAVVCYELFPRGCAPSSIILVAVLAGLLVYSIYLMSFQYRFFHRWEKRLNQLNALEAKLLADEKQS